MTDYTDIIDMLEILLHPFPYRQPLLEKKGKSYVSTNEFEDVPGTIQEEII